MDEGKPVIGIAMVMIATEFIMRLTPQGFDKKRFAVPISVVVAVVLVAVDALIYSEGLWYKTLWLSILRGFVIAMGSGGAYSALKNYKPENKETPL